MCTTHKIKVCNIDFLTLGLPLCFVTVSCSMFTFTTQAFIYFVFVILLEVVCSPWTKFFLGYPFTSPRPNNRGPTPTLLSNTATQILTSTMTLEYDTLTSPDILLLLYPIDYTQSCEI